MRIQKCVITETQTCKMISWNNYDFTEFLRYFGGTIDRAYARKKHWSIADLSLNGGRVWPQDGVRWLCHRNVHPPRNWSTNRIVHSDCELEKYGHRTALNRNVLNDSLSSPVNIYISDIAPTCEGYLSAFYN